MHLIATGRVGAHSSFPHDEDEQRKAVLSCAMSGAPVAFFDNVKGTFGGEAIEGVVTSGELKQRILGLSADVTVPWLATILVTGNNMTMTEDMLRRLLMCRIEPIDEDPSKRSVFAHPDLLDWVKESRPQLIVAALTILRSFTSHGYPDAGVLTMQSFNSWSRLVAGAIKFAGGGDVVETRGTEGSGGSDEAGAVAVFIRDLHKLSPGKAVSTKGILDAIYPAPQKDDDADDWGDLREAIETLAPGRGSFMPDTKRLGEAIRRHLGQVSDGLKLSFRISHKTRKWIVEAIDR